MDTTILQIPIDKKMLAQAKKMSKDMGFGSIQDLIRYFLKLYIDRKVELKLIIKQ